ncbi:pitrilysin family protein [Petroclostridium sp. X23]|uniref:M16 family metallopeptidase n=1 Tax=Petroclostridium sp. X23 TaxID=3045146 RepID=UPI0024ADB5DE|nr:pitrilysin family protein [Petroclostridium sp. X23]WHH58986.1 pitrilysin family protein [Petroclostridium sp. X23]
MYKLHALANGVRIVSEYIPYVRSVSLGIWVGNGSRREDKKNNGISHFIEHMLFKGTTNRSAKDIAESIDCIGGQLNAFTGKESTCFYTKTLDTHIDIAIDVLSDMFFNSKISQSDIDVERKVIMEEINMYEDSPEELVHDILSETIWSADPLGYPILGTGESLQQINRDEISKYMENNYTPSNTVIAIAGNFDYDKVIDLLSKKFENWKNINNIGSNYKETNFNSDIVVKHKDTEQAHLCVGFEGIQQGNDSIYELLVVNTIFGGGMSSRLFQKIREEKGLAYSVYSYPSSYQNAGLFAIYAGMNPSQISEVVKLIFAEVDCLNKNKITKEELDKAKEQLKGNYILGLESTSSRMNSIGKSELLLKQIKTPDQILKRINDITIESVSDIIQKVFDNKNISISAVGTIPDDIVFEKFIR